MFQSPFTPGSPLLKMFAECPSCGLGNAHANVEIQVPALRQIRDGSGCVSKLRDHQTFSMVLYLHGGAFLRLPGNQRTCRKYRRCDHTKVWLRKTRGHEPAFSTKNVVSEMRTTPTIRVAPQRILRTFMMKGGKSSASRAKEQGLPANLTSLEPTAEGECKRERERHRSHPGPVKIDNKREMRNITSNGATDVEGHGKTKCSCAHQLVCMARQLHTRSQVTTMRSGHQDPTRSVRSIKKRHLKKT